MSNPAFLGQMIVDTPGVKREDVEKHILQNLKVLPSLELFQDRVVAWAKETIS